LLLIISLFSTQISAGELKWRAGRTPVGNTSKRATDTRFSKPSAKAITTKRHADAEVWPAEFQKEGPKLAVDLDGSPSFRSVMIGGQETNEGTIPSNAQLAAQETPGAAQDTTAGSQAQLQSGSPFDELPSLPQTETTQPGAMEQPDASQATPGLFNNQATQPADSVGTQERPLPYTPSGPDPRESTIPPPGDTPTPSAEVIETERQRAAAACEESFRNLQRSTVTTVNLNISITGDEGLDYPYECSIDQGGFHSGRAWQQTTYMWKASALCHKPLYFEDEQLERYGHSFPPCCQPFVSGAHFFCTLPVLPYCMGVEPPMECIYALGHYRPGSCAPYMIEPIPISARGAVFQAGAVVGTAAVLP
jgi:hypothetical protein